MKDFLQPSEDEAREYNSRYKLVYGVILICTMVVAGRLWQLQILQGSELQKFSEQNRVKERKLAAPRGLFLDREGRVLVENLPSFVASISPQYTKRLDETAEAIGETLGIPGSRLADDVRKSIHLHLNFGLFADILRDLASTVSRIPRADIMHREQLEQAVAELHKALRN